MEKIGRVPESFFLGIKNFKPANGQGDLAMTDQKFEKVEMSAKELEFAKDRDRLAVLNSDDAGKARAMQDCMANPTGKNLNRLVELGNERKVILNQIKEIQERIEYAPITAMISSFGKPSFEFLTEYIALSSKKGYRVLLDRTKDDVTVSLRLIVNVKGDANSEPVADVVTPDQGPIVR